VLIYIDMVTLYKSKLTKLETFPQPLTLLQQTLLPDHSFKAFHDRAGDSSIGEKAFFVDLVFGSFVPLLPGWWLTSS